jgi:hypothetical protein
LPLTIQPGEFMTIEGVTTVCVTGRGIDGRRIQETPVGPDGMRSCPAIAAFLDGARLPDAGAYLSRTRALDIESIELIRASEAMRRYGLTAVTEEVLVLWSRGLGPYARW